MARRIAREKARAAKQLRERVEAEMSALAMAESGSVVTDESIRADGLDYFVWLCRHFPEKRAEIRRAWSLAVCGFDRDIAWRTSKYGGPFPRPQALRQWLCSAQRSMLHACGATGIVPEECEIELGLRVV